MGNSSFLLLGSICAWQRAIEDTCRWGTAGSAESVQMFGREMDTIVQIVCFYISECLPEHVRDQHLDRGL